MASARERVRESKRMSALENAELSRFVGTKRKYLCKTNERDGVLNVKIFQ